MPQNAAKNATEAAAPSHIGHIARAIPNCLSITRIVLALCLIAIKPLSIAFYILYVFCGISDMLDGFIARKTGVSSSIGAKLDSIADLIMVGILFFKLYPIIRLPGQIIIWVLLIFAIRVISMVLVFLKYKSFAILHTYLNKFTGLLLFLIPIFLINYSSDLWMYVICGIANLSAVEELVIHLTSKELQPDRKSIFL